MLSSTRMPAVFSPVPLLLLLLPFACGDDSESNGNSVDARSGEVADAAADANEESIDSGATLADARIGPDAMPNTTMSFFVTSTGSGAKGGDLGGLADADTKCQNLAVNGGAGARTWHAYLSTGSTGPGDAVDARDRIGSGPWLNQQGTVVATNVTTLHANGILGALILDELGQIVPVDDHDVLTGTGMGGQLSDASQTCDNWTNSTVNSQAQVGHADTEQGDGESWNSQHSGSCDEASLNNNAGTGRLYCFAID